MRCSKIICFGDSNTYGFDPRSYLGDRYEAENRWCDILGKELHCSVINMGQNGRPVPSGSCRVLSRALENNRDCEALIIMLGTNDILLGQEPRHICDKMEKLLLQVKDAGPAIILIAPPEINIQEEPELKARQLSELYEKLAERQGCYFLDSCKMNPELCFDGVHMTEKANRVFAEKLIEFIKEI